MKSRWELFKKSNSRPGTKGSPSFSIARTCQCTIGLTFSRHRFSCLFILGGFRLGNFLHDLIKGNLFEMSSDVAVTFLFHHTATLPRPDSYGSPLLRKFCTL